MKPGVERLKIYPGAKVLKIDVEYFLFNGTWGISSSGTFESTLTKILGNGLLLHPKNTPT
ncbi:MAG: hypothetical protein H6573_29990 [Lewinellaceae bacterium]|nr:hypothetical protein [Lewinellaceae bacterium]